MSNHDEPWGDWRIYPPTNNNDHEPNNRVAGWVTSLVVAVAIALAVLMPGWASSGLGVLPTETPSSSQSTRTPSSGSQRTTVQTQSSVSDEQSSGVVLINTTTTTGTAAGSGMVLSDDGYVLTNYHVVEASTEVTVTIAATNQNYEASVVGHDATNDVALLKLDNASGLDTVAIDDDAVNAGDDVTAVGNSAGQGYLSAAEGQLLSTSSSITVQSEEDSSDTETLTDVYETSAQAVAGDSGGPMFDSENEVIGITTAGQTQTDSHTGQSTTVSSYAIPIARALSIVSQIESGSSSGTVQVGPKAYLGVTVQSSAQTGALVISQVVSDGPAAQAGLAAGETITAVDGTTVSSQEELSTILATKSPGDTVKVTVSSGYGAGQTVSLTLGSSPIN